jgi:hypothetical protein
MFKKISRQAAEQSVKHFMLIIVGLVRVFQNVKRFLNMSGEEIIVSYLLVYFTVHTVTLAVS